VVGPAQSVASAQFPDMHWAVVVVHAPSASHIAAVVSMPSVHD
jgi:hypothetical protein